MSTRELAVWTLAIASLAIYAVTRPHSHLNGATLVVVVLTGLLLIRYWSLEDRD